MLLGGRSKASLQAEQQKYTVRSATVERHSGGGDLDHHPADRVPRFADDRQRLHLRAAVFVDDLGEHADRDLLGRGGPDVQAGRRFEATETLGGEAPLPQALDAARRRLAMRLT